MIAAAEIRDEFFAGRAYGLSHREAKRTSDR
jgi:hypothetical protein